MVKENCIEDKANLMKEFFKIIKKLDQVLSKQLLALIQDSFQMDNLVEKENLFGMIKKNMKEALKMEKWMAKVY